VEARRGKGLLVIHQFCVLKRRVTSCFRSLLMCGKGEGDEKWVLLSSRFTIVAIGSTKSRLGELYLFVYHVSCMFFMYV